MLKKATNGAIVWWQFQRFGWNQEKSMKPNLAPGDGSFNDQPTPVSYLAPGWGAASAALVFPVRRSCQCSK